MLLRNLLQNNPRMRMEAEISSIRIKLPGLFLNANFFFKVFYGHPVWKSFERKSDEVHFNIDRFLFVKLV